MKEDFIHVKVTGPKAVRQEVIDKVFELLMDDEFLEDVNVKKGAMIRIESSIGPSAELMNS